MTVANVLRGILIFTPVIAKAVNAGQANGGLTTQTGIVRGVLPAITTSYIGLNTNDGKFYPRELVWGWGPVIVVGALSKLGLFRKLRF